MSNSKETAKRHDAICIVGAHRSGTSMLTRLLHQCGLNLGPESDLMPARPDNPDGFWENLRFVAINDEVLNQLGGAWDLPPSSDENFKDKRLDPLRTKARLLIEKLGTERVWGWKDPRNSITLPFWQGLLPKLKVVLMVRNPLEVAHSMRERNGTSYAFGLRLWEIYNRRALLFAKNSERIIAHYDSFFENPEAELTRIARFAGLPNDGIKDAAALVVAKKRHTRFDMNRLIDARVSEELIELYRSLIGEAAESTSASPIATGADSPNDILPGASNRLNVSVPDSEVIRRELAELRGAQIENRVALAQRDGRIREMEANAARQEQVRSDLERALREQSAQARADLERVLREQSEQAAEIGRRDAEIEMIRERFLQTNQLLHGKSITLSEQERRTVELTGDLRRQLYATKRLLRLLEDTKAAAKRLRSSRRWKMANPFAAIKALFGTRQSLGYGHLEKVVKEYSQWREAHPEADKIDDALQALNPLARAIVPSSSPNEQSGTKPELAAPTEPIEFKAHDEIDISIIIPVYNQFHFTIACLASIQKHQEAERFEVIVVDDCSTDATPDAISKLAGVIYLRNESNRGFISSCNLGAAKARGEFLVFLNNDTVVTPGWLRALHETFSFEPRAGLVGSKLVYPDGRLQEAGGIIWRDGSGWNWGKFGDAQKPEYNFLREVDYCSAASLMIPKSLFESLGGFDTQYAPCYYEDTDLAFKVRRQGYKVLYQPLSQVIHYEGATGGTDISAGAKKYQEINRATFTTAWAGELEKKPENGDITFLEALQPGQKHILVIDHHLPLTDRDAGSLRMFHIVVLLRKLGHRVTFLPDNVADIPPYGDELRKRGVEVIVHPFTRSVQQFVEEEAAKFDVIILSRCDFAQKHIAQVRRHAPESRIIFDTVDLHHLRQQREAELTQDPLARLSADERKQQEYDIIDQADETWVVSNFERELLHDERPEKSVQVVPTIVEVRASATPFSLRRDFLFIGGFQHTPNIDAVLYFAREIFPLVHERLPAARFYIIGDKAPPEVINLTSEHIIVTGLQPDLRPYFDSVKLSVAPLRYGAGVKGKINQSMAFGVPVVATSLAVEGMELTEGEDVLVADLPNEFARAVVELYENEKLWRMLSENGMEKTRSLYSVETAEEILRRIFSADHAQPESALNRTARQTLETAKEMSLSKPS